MFADNLQISLDNVYFDQLNYICLKVDLDNDYLLKSYHKFIFYS